MRFDFDQWLSNLEIFSNPKKFVKKFIQIIIYINDFQL